MDFGAIAGFWATWQPDRVAVRHLDEALTWQEFDDRTTRLAAGLLASGMRPGDRLAILMTNRIGYVETMIACTKAGIVFVPLNVRFRAKEIEFVLANSGTTVLVTEAAFEKELASVREALPDVRVHDVDGDAFRALSVSGVVLERPDVTSATPMCLCYSSGTTGDPKGAILSHGNWHFASLSRTLSAGVTRDDRVLLPFPLAYTGGLSLYLLTYFAGGAILLEDTFDPGRCIELIEDHGITFLLGVPVIMQQIADHERFATADLGSWRLAMTGGAPTPVPLVEQYLRRGIHLTQVYATTESAANGMFLAPEFAADHLGSCGTPSMNLEVRIVDPESGHECGPDEVGEIVLRGPQVMQGYWEDPAATAEALVDGWLHTGDVGKYDPDGFFYVTDRLKDMIISGGLNVYPAEIERALGEVTGVAELAVFGVPDDRWGESPAVVMVAAAGSAAPTADQVMEICRRSLADFKLPRYVVIRDEPLPRNMAGKVLKRDLRVEYRELPTSSTPVR